MTENQDDRTSHTDMTNLRANTTTPCAECPWRRSNVGRPVPEKYAGTYDRPQRVNAWSSLRHGYRELCHLSAGTDVFPQGGDPDWMAMGFVEPPGGAAPRPCSGYVAAVDRELHRARECGTWEVYQATYPAGLTLQGFQAIMRRAKDPAIPSTHPVRVDADELVDPSHEDNLTARELLDQQQVGERRPWQGQDAWGPGGAQ